MVPSNWWRPFSAHREKGQREQGKAELHMLSPIPELDFLVHLVMWWIFNYPEPCLAINWQLKSSNVVTVVTKHHIRRILRITCEANMELSIVGIWSGRQEKAVVVHYPQILPRKRRQNTRATCRNHTADAWTKPYSLIKHISCNQNAQSLTKAYKVPWTIACDFLTSL